MTREIRIKAVIDEIRVSNNGTASKACIQRTIVVPAATDKGYKGSKRACTEFIYALIDAGLTNEARVFKDSLLYPDSKLKNLLTVALEKEGE